MLVRTKFNLPVAVLFCWFAEGTIGEPLPEGRPLDSVLKSADLVVVASVERIERTTTTRLEADKTRFGFPVLVHKTAARCRGLKVLRGELPEPAFTLTRTTATMLQDRWPQREKFMRMGAENPILRAPIDDFTPLVAGRPYVFFLNNESGGLTTANGLFESILPVCAVAFDGGPPESSADLATALLDLALPANTERPIADSCLRAGGLLTEIVGPYRLHRRLLALAAQTRDPEYQFRLRRAMSSYSGQMLSTGDLRLWARKIRLDPDGWVEPVVKWSLFAHHDHPECEYLSMLALNQSDELKSAACEAAEGMRCEPTPECRPNTVQTTGRIQ